jgi:integrase
MPRVRIPKYRKHKPSNLAVVSLGGKDYYLGKYGTKESHEEYARRISEYLKRRGEQVPAEIRVSPHHSKNITVVEAADRYLTWVTSERSPAEQAHVHGMLTCLVNLYENELAAAIGPAELREVRRVMVAKGWCRNYVNEQIGRLKRMYQWLAAEPLIPITTYHAILVVGGLRRGEGGARETEPILPVDEATVDATLPHLPETIADMLRLQRITGMRPNEVCLLRPCDIDRSDAVWFYRPITHKMAYRGRERVICIGPQAQRVLLRYLARDRETFCFSPRDSESKRRAPRGRGKGFVFAGQYDAGVYRRAIHRACDKAFPHPALTKIKASDLTGIQRKELRIWKSANRWSPNQLRHAAATEIRRKFGLEAAQIVLGHAKADVTQIYAERDLAKGVEVALRIG